MFANKYEINITTISTASTATTINIPINLEYQLVDQSELVDRVFVATEVKKSINPIFDYEKIRLVPTSAGLNILTGTSTSTSNINNNSNSSSNNSTANNFNANTTNLTSSGGASSVASSNAASNLVAAPPSSNIVAAPSTNSSLNALANVGTGNAATLGGFPVSSGVGNTFVNSGGNFGNIGSGGLSSGNFGGGLSIAFSSSNNPLPSTFNSTSCPINLSGNNINNVVYNVRFLTGNPPAITTPTTYNDIGFTDGDIKFRTNAFEQTFLNLLFYDSDNALEQRLISYITLFPNLTGDDLNPLDSTTGLPGQPKLASEIPVSFVISNPLLDCPLSVSEGFYLYEYKDTIPMGSIKYLYMRASFNNAKTGKSVNLMVDDSPYTIDSLVNKLYTRYILVRNNTGFYYKIDENYNLNTTGNHIGFNNVTYTNNNIIVDLYQIQAL